MSGNSSSIFDSHGAIEMKDDFGRNVRRVMHSTSGAFSKLNAGPAAWTNQQVFTVGNGEWTRYKELAEYAAQCGNYSQAEAMWLAALAIAKEFSEKDERLAITLDNLASLYFLQGRFDQAEVYCKQALAVTICALGREHVRVANCMNSLAGIYYCQRLYSSAEPLCLKVISIYERVYGRDHADVGMAANNLAMLYHAMGHFGDADRYYQQALRIRAQVLGNFHPCVLTLLENYSNLLKSVDRLKQAEQLSAWARGSHQRLQALQPAV